MYADSAYKDEFYNLAENELMNVDLKNRKRVNK